MCLVECATDRNCESVAMETRQYRGVSCGIYNRQDNRNITSTLKIWNRVARAPGRDCMAGFSSFGNPGGCYMLYNNGTWTGDWFAADSNCSSIIPGKTRLAGNSCNFLALATQQAFLRLWLGKTRVIGPSKPGLLV